MDHNPDGIHNSIVRGGRHREIRIRVDEGTALLDILIYLSAMHPNQKILGPLKRLSESMHVIAA